MGSGTSYHIINIKKIQEKSLAIKVKGCRDNLSSKGWGGGGENNIRYGCEIFCLF